MNELGIAYEAAISGEHPKFSETGASYLDFVAWQEDLLRSPRGQELYAYWSTRLAGDLPQAGFPTDRQRPAVQTYEGRSKPFQIAPALWRQINLLAEGSHTTPYAILLAGIQILLHRYSSVDDVLIGSPASGRTSARWAHLVGYCVNPLVLRSRFSRKHTVQTFLSQTRENVLSALQNQSFPFQLLVERLCPERNLSSSPIFQTMFVWQQSHL
jgi:hypothetical protein